MTKHYDTICIANLPVAGKTETKGAWPHRNMKFLIFTHESNLEEAMLRGLGFCLLYQNRRQKILNRGALGLWGGTWHSKAVVPNRGAAS